MMSREKDKRTEALEVAEAADRTAPEAAAAADAGQAKAAEPQPSAEALRRELDETRERLLRVSAELDNLRKRTARQLEEQRRYAALPLMRDLLPVLDNLRRAMDAAEIASHPEEMIRGVEMIRRQLSEALARHGCKEVEAEGRRFDPAVHEAVQQTAGSEEGMVLDVVRPGYMLHDRLVRPAQVVVSCGPSQDPKQKEGERDRPGEPEGQ